MLFRSWDLESRKSTITFVDHVKGVLSCSLSADNSQIATGSTTLNENARDF